MSYRFVYITTSSRQEARRIGRALVEARLAACVNVLDGMNSLYWWEGQIQDEQEVVLIAKSREALLPALTEKVKALHSYSCPCVVALPIVGGNQDFLAWIGRETGADG
jgi:periplasmic divalent cation tolerance protein